MSVIGLSEDDQNNLVRLLASILHLVRKTLTVYSQYFMIGCVEFCVLIFQFQYLFFLQLTMRSKTYKTNLSVYCDKVFKKLEMLNSILCSKTKC